MTRILAIETSCDETAAAVIEDGRHILSNVVATQIELHRRFGGVFPEVASRQHVLSIHPVVRQALNEAGIERVADLDALAVTMGPGLAGSLLVGVNAAKGLALGADLPLVGVNHLEGHIYSNWLAADGLGGPVPDDAFPLLVLIVSGGHTELVLMSDHGQYQRLGGTLDDAAGEAFDKVARLVGLGFPGGPAIQRAAQEGDEQRFKLPRPLQNRPDHRYDFSFSGLKTAVLHLVRKLEKEGEDLGDARLVADLAASFQAAVTDVLITKCAAAVAEHQVRHLCICGGVSANAALRAAAESAFGGLNIPIHIPPIFLCTDNAAMIGAAAYYGGAYHGDAQNLQSAKGLALDVSASLRLSTTQKDG